jgi:hypothetical protein
MVGPDFESHVVILGDKPNTKFLEELERLPDPGDVVAVVARHQLISRLA